MISIKLAHYTKESIRKLTEIFEEGLLEATRNCSGKCAICKCKRACNDCSRTLAFLYKQEENTIDKKFINSLHLVH